MNDRIAQALTRLFEKHRIVFWFDNKLELCLDYESLSLPGVEKIRLSGNEYGVKYRVLREQPEHKFLLYHEGPQPDDLDNWLLDVLLAHGEFRTDQVGLWLSELELGLEFSDLVQEHAEFFRAVKRKEALKGLLSGSDTPGDVRMKMLAVCAGSDPRVEAVMESLLQELSERRDDRFKLIGRCALDRFLLMHLERSYGYMSDDPSLRDFAVELFKSCYAMETGGSPSLKGDALVFLKRWKDSRRYAKPFESLSNEYAEVLRIESDLAGRDFRELMELDYFRLVDNRILSELVRAVASRTVPKGEVSVWVRQRRQGYWFKEFRHLYEAIEIAAEFLHSLDKAKLTMESLYDGVERYCRSWFRLDQLYRNFTYHVRMSGEASLMGVLVEKIENLYSNSFLLKVNDAWQVFVDKAEKWDAAPITLQKRFFEHWVQPFLKKDNRVCVIISDALRYEIGDELLGRIRQEDRFDAELEPALGMIPSYTQLGMAALLPNKELLIPVEDPASVVVDGMNSKGTANRAKILDHVLPLRATALKAEELLSLNKDESRTLVRDNDLIYIYHNCIDAMGDKRETEEKVFEAVEDAMEELIRLIKKLTAANVNNLLVTSDHGFIYQNRAIDESDFAGLDAEGDQILARDRRFVLGKGLKATSSFRKFVPHEIGLAGEVEVLIPKSINRLRQKGSGSRFVHGGASLQEVVIPVLKVNKKRQSDVSEVEVEILPGTSSVITSGQLGVVFYQAQPVTDKVQSRKLRAGIYTEAGQLISDSHELLFDHASENPRDREVRVRFVFTSRADEANGQQVILRLEERLAGTSHYREYRSLRYTMRRSFTSDFDF